MVVGTSAIAAILLREPDADCLIGHWRMRRSG
jgi:uncharacterized protein with PIN domain